MNRQEFQTFPKETSCTLLLLKTTGNTECETIAFQFGSENFFVLARESRGCTEGYILNNHFSQLKHVFYIIAKQHEESRCYVFHDDAELRMRVKPCKSAYRTGQVEEGGVGRPVVLLE